MISLIYDGLGVRCRAKFSLKYDGTSGFAARAEISDFHLSIMVLMKNCGKYRRAKRAGNFRRFHLYMISLIYDGFGPLQSPSLIHDVI